jgi:Ca2+-binding RTX toxin-like protein
VGRRLVIGALILMAAAAYPAAALADARATRRDAEIDYEDLSGELNTLMVSLASGQYIFHERGNVLVDGTGMYPATECADVPGDDHGAQCPVGGVEIVKIALADMDDILSIDDSASPLGPVPRFVVDGGPGKDTLTGGAGREELLGDTGNDQLNGGGGDDRLDFPDVDPQKDQSTGDDRLDGGPGNDQLNGGPTELGQGADDLHGGDGIDTADYTARTDRLRISLDGANDDGETDEHDNVEPDVEQVTGGSDDDTLVGSGANNFLDGRNGDDRISGSGGDDVLDGGANTSGSDSLDGGDGNDTLSGRAGDDGLDGDSGDDSLSGAGGTDTLHGGDGNDDLGGGAGSDTVDGGPGDDIVNGAESDLTGADGADDLGGGAGADTLLGADGNDKLDGGPGPDVIDGGDGTDTVDYEGRSRKVTVTLDDVANDGEPLEGDNVRRNVENVLGGTVGDDLSGDGDTNTLDGGPGEDLVIGNGGGDNLQGGNAPDVILARDGKRDRVNCGDDGDLAITDPQDVVRDCTWEDPGGRRRLAVAQSALVTGGTFKFRLPDARRYYGFEDPLKLPMGSTIDARAGAVRVATATSSTGARQEVRVSGGPFTVRQQAGKQPTTDLRLVGSAQGCTRSASGPRAPSDARAPKLDTQTAKRKPGKYRVRGKHSIGAPKGTSWVTEERCDGTFTQVRRGTVRVRDLERDRTVVLHAGDTYLARPR